MKSFRLILTALSVVAMVVGGFTNRGVVAAMPLTESQDDELSAYWSYSVRRWDDLIIQEAERRELDADFLASVVWVESKGNSDAISRAGAVGLMQVMPKEAGFSWRPTEEELLNPFTNLYWGARTLSTVIRQGHGDVFNALAAYNGGWEKTDRGGPRYLATNVLREYAGAVAARHDLSGRWVAYFALRDLSIHGPIWVADSDRDDVYFYGYENQLPEGEALIPMRMPTSILAHCVEDETNAVYDVGLWLYDAENGVWVGQTLRSVSALMTFAVATVAASVPEPVHDSTPAPAPALAQATPTPEPVAPAVPAPETPEPPAPAPSDAPTVAAAAVVATPEPVVDTPTPEPEDAPVITPTLIPCGDEPLWGDAWALHTENTDYGWKAVIFAEGHGGACQYTYAWNVGDNVKGGPMQGGVIFEVQSTRRDSVIIGTVLIQSGDSAVEVGIYVPPPDGL